MSDMNMMGGMPRPDNHEAAMARADLYKLANYSFKLFKMVKDGDELEGWVQAKITKAADYIASVYHFMEYEMKFSEYGEKLETSDVYSEQIKREFKRKLTEARVKLEKLREKNITDLNEGKDDERGGDDDTPGKFNVKKTEKGTQYNRKSKSFSDEPEKKVSKTAPTGAERRAEKSKDTSQADSKNWQARFGKGSVTRHTLSDKEPTKKVKEGSLKGGVWRADAPTGGAPNVPVPSPDEGPTTNIRTPMKKPAPKTLDLEAAKRDPRFGTDPKFTKAVKDAEAFAAAFSSAPIREALKGGQKNLDVDGDKKIEKSDLAKLRASKGVKEELKGEAEWKMNSHADHDKAKKAHADFEKEHGKENVKWGSKNKLGVPTIMVRTSNKDVKEASSEKCNHSPKGKSCPVHGLKECGPMESIVAEKAVSKAQQKFMGMVHATKKGEKAPSKEVAKAAKGMSAKAAKDYASTKHKGLPAKKD